MPQKKNHSWYDKKWSNKRALTNKERRAEKKATTKAPSSTQIMDEFQSASQLKGIIAEVQRSYYMVLYGDRYVNCIMANTILSSEVESLVVGDRVIFDLEEDDSGVIRQVLLRKTKLVRMRQDSTKRSEFAKEEHVLAANVDAAVIVASAASPPFHVRLVDRYLIMCQYGNISPAICINKCDLVTQLPDLTVYERMGIPVMYVSVSTGRGLEDLRAFLHGKISVLTGQSGVGKSSIINWLLGKDVLRVGKVGDTYGKGRHTTTVSTLNTLDNSSFMIDTPGIRSLGLWQVDKDTLRFYFPEFDKYSLLCKFRDCLHVSEPGCAVKDAVSHNEIARERYDSYLRMLKE